MGEHAKTVLIAAVAIMLAMVADRYIHFSTWLAPKAA